ncbi:MAG: HipA domain-containing protein [Mangrovibacterium sp.]
MIQRQYLPVCKIEKNSGARIARPGKVPTIKKHQYRIVHGYTITGDAPKEFIRVYEYGAAPKACPNKWPLYIAKTGHKWYPTESITEYLLNVLGVAFGLEMAHSKIAWIGGQVRFLSRYFLLTEKQELIHGADIFAGFVNDREFVEQVEEQQLARDLFTLQFTKEALKFTFPYHWESILNQFVKMLLFDALVGNNDRHFYNWGVIRHIESKHEPRFSPIYDTARGLFWNESEKKILTLWGDKKRLQTYLSKYCTNSRPKIGWEGATNINHFKLVYNTYKNEFGITKSEINHLFLQSRFEKMVESIQMNFSGILGVERTKLIVECLNFRYHEISKQIGG